MGKYYELNDLEIEIYGFNIPLAKEDEQRYNELVEKAGNLKKEIAKECKEAIKHLAELIKNCSNAYEMLSIRIGEDDLRGLLELVIGRLREFDPQNILFQKKKLT